MSDISEALRSELRDPEYSEGYAESFLNSYIATQIKVMREQRKMKQFDLAKEMGTTQTAISRIENVNYSSWNIKTLKKLARAFRVRLRVSFETYGTLPDEVGKFTRESLQRAAREDDPGLLERRAPQREEAGARANIAIANLLNPPEPKRYNSNVLIMPGEPIGNAGTIPAEFIAAAQKGMENATLSDQPRQSIRIR
jgi:transcriptional regulator with XRE-family HTH domain